MFLKAYIALKTFRKEESGLALTEYLILLGLLTGAVILSVTLFGEGLDEGWSDWANWISGGEDGDSPLASAPTE